MPARESESWKTRSRKRPRPSNRVLTAFIPAAPFCAAFLLGIPHMAKVYIYGMYGLGGRLFSAAMEDIVAAELRRLGNVFVAPTLGYREWQSIADYINMQPRGSKSVVMGHSMGAAAATYVTDVTRVDLVVCYDNAGQRCSGIANNCGKLLDFQDTAWTFVPKFRPWAYPGHERKIFRTQVAFGHTRCPQSTELLGRVIKEVKFLIN